MYSGIDFELLRRPWAVPARKLRSQGPPPDHYGFAINMCIQILIWGSSGALPSAVQAPNPRPQGPPPNHFWFPNIMYTQILFLGSSGAPRPSRPQRPTRKCEDVSRQTPVFFQNNTSLFDNLHQALVSGGGGAFSSPLCPKGPFGPERPKREGHPLNEQKKHNAPLLFFRMERAKKRNQ